MVIYLSPTAGNREERNKEVVLRRHEWKQKQLKRIWKYFIPNCHCTNKNYFGAINVILHLNRYVSYSLVCLPVCECAYRCTMACQVVCLYVGLLVRVYQAEDISRCVVLAGCQYKRFLYVCVIG